MTVTAKLTGPPEADAAVIEQSWTRPERFAVIFERYFAPVHQYLARRVGDKAADDLAAEVFVAAFAHRQRYDLARDCARPWLHGIPTNVIGTHRRQEQRLYHALATSGSPSTPAGAATRFRAPRPAITTSRPPRRSPVRTTGVPQRHPLPLTSASWRSWASCTARGS